MRACECEELCKCEMFADTGRCCDCVWATKTASFSEEGRCTWMWRAAAFFFFFLPDNALLMCLDGRRGRGVSGVWLFLRAGSGPEGVLAGVFHGKNEKRRHNEDRPSHPALSRSPPPLLANGLGSHSAARPIKAAVVCRALSRIVWC